MKNLSQHLLIFGFLLQFVFSQNLNWTQLHYPTAVGITDIETLENNSILCATTGAGIFISDNHGENWEPLNAGLDYLYIQDLFESDSGEIYSVSTDGVYRFNVETLIWENLNAPVENYQEIVVIGDQRIVTAINSGIHYSLDAGLTWFESETPNLPSFTSFTVREDSTIFAGTSNGVYLSTDLGVSWTLGGLETLWVNDIKLDSENNLTALVYYRGYGTFVSQDSGASWRQNNSGLEQVLPWTLTISDGDDTYVGTTDGVIFSKADDEENYQAIDSDAQFSHITSITLDQTGNMLIGTALGGLYFRDSDELNFIPINCGLPMAQGKVLGVSGEYWFAANEYNGVYRSSTQGVTWFPIAPHLGGSHKFTFLGSDNEALLGTTIEIVWVGYLWRTVNDGVVFDVFQDGLPLVDPELPWVNVVLDMDQDSDGTRYALLDIDGLFRLDAESQTWWNISDNLDSDDLESMCIGNDDAIYVGSRSGGIFYTLDDGDNWNVSLDSQPGSSVHSLKRGRTHVLALRSKYGVTDTTESYRILNYGATWQSLNTDGLGDHINTIVEYDEVNLMLGTDSSGIYTSSDNGSSWQSNNEGLDALNINSITYDSDEVFICGTNDGGLFRTSLPPSEINQEKQTPDQLLVLNAYPNPFNPSTTLQYNLPVSSMVKICLYNSLGQVVIELVNEHQDAGLHRLSFDGKQLSSGIYIVQLQSESYQATTKVVMLK